MESRSAGAVATGEVLLKLWLAHLASLNHPLSTLRAYGNDVAGWLLFLAKSGVSVDTADVETIEIWMAQLRELELNSRTIARRISACREFYRWARARKKLPDNPFLDIGRMKHARRLPRFLRQQQVEALIDAAAKVSGRKTIHVDRNRAIIELFYAAGCRLGELHQLDLEHVSFEAGTVLLFGKGQKERLVPIGQPCVEALKASLPTRTEILRKKERFYERALFVSERGTRLSRDSIQEVVEKAGAKLGLDVHCHMLRHSYGTHMVEGGTKLEDLQDLLGHIWIETTRGYVHTAVSRLRKVYDQAHPRARSLTKPPGSSEDPPRASDLHPGLREDRPPI